MESTTTEKNESGSVPSQSVSRNSGACAGTNPSIFGASRCGLAYRHRQDGFILIIVLGALLLLSIIASTLMMATRTHLQVRAALEARAELTALADGMVRLTALRLTERLGSADVASRLPVDGTPMLCLDGDILITSRVNDTAGLIDINASSADVMNLVLRGLGLPPRLATQLAKAIQTFRDPDDSAGGAGSKSEPYLLAGRPFGPKNGPFDSVDELDQVPDMSPEILAILRPLVTVHSRAPGIDPTVAPLALLRALTVVAGGAGLPLPQGGPGREQFKLPPQMIVRANPRAPSRTRIRAFAIDVTAARGSNVQFSRQAVIELSAQSEFGFYVREWTSRMDFPDKPRTAGGNYPPCMAQQ
jgi:general secretion pathway protein K